MQMKKFFGPHFRKLSYLKIGVIVFDTDKLKHFEFCILAQLDAQTANENYR